MSKLETERKRKDEINTFKTAFIGRFKPINE